MRSYPLSIPRLFSQLKVPYHAIVVSLACSYRNQEGIQIRPYDFGGLGGIYSIDPDLPSFTATYKPIIDKLTDAGYTEDQDLFGAPYDFRLAGDGLASVSTHPCSRSMHGIAGCCSKRHRFVQPQFSYCWVCSLWQLPNTWRKAQQDQLLTAIDAVVRSNKCAGRSTSALGHNCASASSHRHETGID